MAERKKVRNARAALLLVTALTCFGILVLLPLALVFTEAFRDGAGALWSRLQHPHTRHAMVLTAKVVAVAVPLNLVFGLAAAWGVTQYRFWGRGLMMALIDVPLTVSTVVAGLMLVTLVGPQSPLGGWLAAHDLRVLHAYPSLVLVTVFVTMPLIARELMPTLQARGVEQEHAALTLGAGRFSVWWRITLPALRSSILAGVILCVARAAGEYGAVAVVSGNVRGRTQTMSLQVDALYNDYDFVGAFGVAALLACSLAWRCCRLPWQEPAAAGLRYAA